MKRYVCESWLWLLVFEVVILVTGLRGLSGVRKRRARTIASDDRCSSSVISHAIDLACVLYFKEVNCLQRSALAAFLLRRYGWNAELILGAQLIPLKNHAWTEIDGEVINDKPYMHEMYQVLERR